MTPGQILQFRYREGLVSNDVAAKIEANQLNETKVLLAYLSPGSSSETPTAIPCRMAEIAKAEHIGCWYVLHLRLGEYAWASDLTKSNRAFKSGIDQWPQWDSNKEKLIGDFCSELDQDSTPLLRYSSKEDRNLVWQNIVEQIDVYDSDLISENHGIYYRCLLYTSDAADD